VVWHRQALGKMRLPVKPLFIVSFQCSRLTEKLAVKLTGMVLSPIHEK
jgi:hypothetical protein